MSNNYKLALKMDLDGVYIPSFNSDLKHLNYPKKKNFIVLGSAHNIKEIRIKEVQKVDAIFNLFTSFGYFDESILYFFIERNFKLIISV